MLHFSHLFYLILLIKLIFWFSGLWRYVVWQVDTKVVAENIASIFNCQIKKCHNPEDYNMNFLQHENLKTNILISDEKYKLQSYSLRSFLEPSITFFLLSPNVLLSLLFSDSLIL
jgi:hypothetical protein